MNKILFQITGAILFIILIGCEKDDDHLRFNGDIVGFVTIYDEYGVMLTDKSGVEAKIESTDFSSITDDIGKYVLKNIPAGTYNILFGKAGIGENKLYSLQFVGGSVPAVVSKVSLYQLPTIEIQDFQLSLVDDKILCTVIMPEPCMYDYRIFMNDSLNVSESHYDYFITHEYQKMDTIFIGASGLEYTPFEPGQNIYTILYYKNYLDPGYYMNELGSKKQNYIKASEVIEFELKE